RRAGLDSREREGQWHFLIWHRPALELAWWLAARSKGAYFNLNLRGEYWIDAGDALVAARADHAATIFKISFFIKSDPAADAIRAAVSKRRLALKGGRGPAPISGRRV